MNIAISSETTIDLTKELLEKYDISLIPFFVVLGEHKNIDIDISTNEIIDYVDKTNCIPTTSAINVMQYKKYFEDLLEKYDAVIHISFSSKLSSTYSNAVKVATEYFSNKVYIIDSLSLSTGIALQAIYARELTNQNIDIKKIVQLVEERRNKVQASFVLKKINYLHKGGRCPTLVHYIARIFHICPQIILKNGQMKLGHCFHGLFSKVINKYMNFLFKKNDPDLSMVFITFTTLENSNEVIEVIKSELIKRKFKQIYVTNASATILSHCGPNTIGILWYNK